MKRCFFFLAAIVLVLVLAGCGPANTLFPLFVKGEKEFDDRLLGEWRFQGDGSFKHGERSGRMVFRKSADGTEYQVTLFDFDEKGLNLAIAAHLARLGNFVFIDFGTPDADKRKFKLFPFPVIESHFFGRIHLEKDSVRLDLLSDEWIKERVNNGTLALATVQIADGRAISATTEELRTFALEHAEDTAAFSEHYSLSRTK
jgi:hypothetical protein